jgi:murein DD-endopeptidase MepM/ murein hydrolase activator NlpD
MPVVTLLISLLFMALLAPASSRAVAAAAAAPAADAGGAATIEVSLTPAQPVQGTLFMIQVREAGGSIAAVRGTFAGEALHFERLEDGRFRAVAAVPIDASGSSPLELVVERTWGERSSLRPSVPVAPGEYRLERLTVAPRFGRQPDAETAARIRADAERAREVSRRSHATPRLWDGEFVRPRESRITSGFGHGREFNGEVQSRHMGTDFAGAVGAPVHATAGGIVALVDSFHLGGNVVYLDHGAGLVSGYLHLSRAEVAQGETVVAGQLIGRVGATGRVTGPHLHWLVRYGGITVDPTSLLQLGESLALPDDPR